MAYRHPGLINNALPTTGQLRNALKLADEPDPAKRDTRPLMAIISALPKADPDVLGFMQTRRLKILSWPWAVKATVPSGQTSAPVAEEQRAAEIESRIRGCGIANEFDVFLNALFFGHTAIEPLWSRALGGSMHAIESYQLLDSVDLIPDASSIVGWSKCVYPSYASDKYVKYNYQSREEVILATYNPMKGSQANYVGGLLRAIALISIIKYGVLYDWSRFSEKYGDPPLIARYPAGASKEELDTVFSFLTNLAQDSVAALPDDIKTEILEVLKGTANVDVFDRLIDKITSRQERIILGQDVVNKTTEVGSLAKAKEANTTTADYNWADIEQFQNWMTEQLVAVDYRLNYGVPSTGLYPRFTVITDEGEDALNNARIIETLRAADFDLDENEVSRRTGFTVTKRLTPDIPAVD